MTTRLAIALALALLAGGGLAACADGTASALAEAAGTPVVTLVD